MSPSHVLRRLALIFLPVALILGGLVLILYYLDRAKEHALFEQAGSHLVELHAELINREMHSVQSDVLYLANQAILRDYLAGKAGNAELQEEYTLFARQRGIYDQIRYLDADGQEGIRINFNGGQASAVPKNELQFKGNRYYFIETMRLDRGQIFVSPLDLNVERDEIERPLKPTIRFATPVFDGRGNKKGIVILNYLAAGLIGKLVEVSVTFPGSALLLNRNGYFLRGPTPDDEWGFMLGRHDRTFGVLYPKAWPRLNTTEQGQFHTSQGLFTFRALTPPHAPGPRTPRPASLSDPDAADPTLVVVSHVPASVLDEPSGRLLRTLLLLYGLVLVLVLVLAWYLAKAGALRREHEEQIAASEARLRTLSSQLLTAQEEERRSLSRDLHDELGQVITAVTLDLQRSAQASDLRKKDELIGRALHGTECMLERMHEISARIRPTVLDDLGLKDAVQSMLGEYEHRTGIVPRADLRFERPDVPRAVSENIYRILQEALNNVAKHARTSEVFVELEVRAGQLSLKVRDRGAGFTPEAVAPPGTGRDGRLGLLGMRERAELLHGDFAVTAAPGQGTEIRVTIPVPRAGA